MHVCVDYMYFYVEVGDIETLYHDIWRNDITILLYTYHDIFSVSMILIKLRVIILNKEIPYVDDFYLKFKSKYGPLLGRDFMNNLMISM